MSEVYAAIRQLEESFAVSVLCESLNVSRSAYYAWRQDGVSARQRDDNRLRPMIRSIFWEHRRRYGARRIAEELGVPVYLYEAAATRPDRRRYGARRIAAELSARDEPCSRRRVGRLMHEMGLVAIQPKSFKPRTTDSHHSLGYSPNLLLDAPPPDSINQLWVGDITYVPLLGGDFLYLAMLMDRFSRRIVGWDLQDHMRESLVLAALRAALALRQPRPGLVHHTDRGGQYAGAQYRKMLARAGMAQSMSRAEDCYDNAFMESCFGTLKTELEMEAYLNAHAARKEIPDYIRYY